MRQVLGEADVRWIDAILAGPPQDGEPSDRARDREALDAYSDVVTSVAERLIP